MSSICASLAVKKDVAAVLIFSDGKVVDKYVTRIRDKEILKNTCRSTLGCAEIGVRRLKVLMEAMPDIDDAVFETDNKRVVNWVRDDEASDDCLDLFDKLMSELDELPVTYSFVFNSRPKAVPYAKESCLSAPKIGGLDISAFDDVDEEEKADEEKVVEAEK